MKFEKNHLVISLIIIISFFASFYYYESLPEQIPIHWNAFGEVDGYAPKNVGVFFLPLIEIALAIILVIVPLIEPNKKNVKQFIKQYNLFAVAIIAFFGYLHFLTLLIAKGYAINFNQFFVPAIGILFYFIGVMVKSAKQNYTIGIRTPWTLASKEVWDKTHKLGGKLFQISGIICLLAIIVPEIGIFLIIGPIIFSAIISVVYSYYIYSKIK